jgi:hypothetical protein
MAPGRESRGKGVLFLVQLCHPMTKKLPVIMPPKIKESTNLTDPNATRKEQHKLQPKRLQPFNTTAAAEARPRSKHAPPASPSQASTSSTATERQRVVEANRKEAEEAQKLLDTANKIRGLAEENRKLKLQLQREKKLQREESTPPKLKKPRNKSQCQEKTVRR